MLYWDIHPCADGLSLFGPSSNIMPSRAHVRLYVERDTGSHGRLQGSARRRVAVQLEIQLPLSTSCAEGSLSRAESLAYDGPRTDIGLCLIFMLSQEVNALLSVLSSGKVSPSQH
jgi:hypothetical protein